MAVETVRVAISGPPGSGKSSLLARFIHDDFPAGEKVFEPIEQTLIMDGKPGEHDYAVVYSNAVAAWMIGNILNTRIKLRCKVEIDRQDFFIRFQTPKIDSIFS